MRNMSKKLLSMALVIAMVLSLVPMSFAAGEEATSDVTIKYALSEVLCEGATQTSKDYFSYEKTNGFYNIAAMSQTTIGTKYLKISSYPNYNCGLLTVRPNNWLIFEINVPVKGTYELWINNNVKNSFGNIEAYIFPTSVAANATALSNTDYYVGTLVCDSDNGATTGMAGYVFSKDTANPFKDGEENATHYFETAGKYYIGMKVVSDGDTGENNDCSFADFYLIGGDKYALIGDMTLSSDSVKAGGTAQATATAYKSDDASAVTAFAYDSSNKDVATVDSEGNITTLKAGTTTITATAADSVNSLSCELTVTPANVSDVTISYRTMDLVDVDMKKETSEQGEFTNAINYTTTNGFFRFYNDSLNDKYVAKNEITTDGLNLFKYNYSQWIIFEVYVPVAGAYNLKTNNNVAAAGGKMYAYIFPSSVTPTNQTFIDSSPVGMIDCDKDNDVSGGWTGTTGEYVATVDNANYFTDTGAQTGSKSTYTFDVGTYYIGFKAVDGYMYFSNFYLVSGDGSKNALMGVSEKELVIGTTGTVNAYLSSTGEAITENVTYESDNDDVATVANDGTITAKAYGDANITVTYSGEIVGSNSLTTKVSVKDAKLDNTVQVYTDALTGGMITRTTNDTIDNVTVGTLVEVEAIADTDYVFSHWQDSEGKYVSDSSTYSFRPYVNTSVIAVFDKTTVEDGDTKTVYFYNGNGEYMTEKTTTESTIEMPADATLTGYIFDMWTVDGVNEFNGTNIVKAITRVVAQYLENGKTYESLKINNTETVVYDEEMNFNDNSATHWKRGGKTIAYGKDYKHYMWDAATIEAGTGDVEEVPVILLDEHSVESDFYMIEYDLPEGYTKLEAGILFGDSTHNTVDSCYYKAKSANKPETAEHGQFTAKPSTDTTKTWNVVRGYLVYSDGTTNRVIYAN